MDNVDTTSLIFDHLFACKISQLDLYDENYIRVFGSPTTMDKQIDTILRTQMVSVYLPIAQIAEHYTKGSKISITQEDAKLMFDYISRHLSAWANFLKTSINTSIAPIDDLKKLDELAKFLFQYVRYDIKDEAEFESEIIRRLRRLNASPLKEEPLSNRKEEELPQRTGFEEVMKQLNIKRGTGRGW